MLASLGALVPEVLDILGAFHFVEPVWWRVGYSKLKVIFALVYIPSSLDMFLFFPSFINFLRRNICATLSTSLHIQL